MKEVLEKKREDNNNNVIKSKNVSIELLRLLNNISYKKGFNRNIPFDILKGLPKDDFALLTPFVYHSFKQGVKSELHIRWQVILNPNDEIHYLLDLPLDTFNTDVYNKKLKS
jgi:hypothetical protein